MSKKLFTATFTWEGKRYYVRSAKSQRDADKRAAIRQRELEEAREIISPETTVEKYAVAWLETYKRGNVSEPVYNAMRSSVIHVIVPQIGHMRLKDVRPINAQKTLNSQSGKSKNYYVKLRNLLNSIFTRAQGDHLIRDNPAAALELPKAEDGTHRSITDDERRALIYTATWSSFGPFVLAMLWCGLRTQEAAALRYEDIDQINRTIHVQRALKADGSIGATKSKAGNRIVPIPPQLWPRLRLREGYLFRDTLGNRMTRTSIRKAWAMFKRHMDINMGAMVVKANGYLLVNKSVIADDLEMYDLRHTYCTDLQAAGVPIDVARYLMGHSDISMTSRIYTHMREDTFADAAAKIAAFGAASGATAGATVKRPKALQSTAKSKPTYQEVAQ